MQGQLCVPANASPERKLILKAFGAEPLRPTRSSY